MGKNLNRSLNGENIQMTNKYVKSFARGWVWLCKLLFPSAREAEIGESWFKASLSKSVRTI
jgi:hypothetical protein